MSNAFSNRLINESSPYLMQHAHNPVDWYPWGEEALQKAKTENKVILVSIGYSACHWCHVMEKESFENEAVAKFMNEHFINIKIDREERPDLDHIYMDAVQAMTGSGGWPLNVFLTPEARPFYGGTYFPPVKAYDRSSWTEVLNGVQRAWKEKEAEIISQAESLTRHIQRSNDFGIVKKEDKGLSPDIFTAEDADTIFQNIMAAADKEWGGFGKAPKFPQTFTIQYLLQYYYFTGNEEALQQAILSIDKMLEGGIYDQVGGGFARYSTDEEWLAPHFEKMLYDNALLVNILCDAYQITKDKHYENAIRKTIAFVERELMDSEGGFYAALDADSEGEEGKYYVWDKKEIDALLGNDSPLFCEYFDITEAGNWSHIPGAGKKNILRILKKDHLFAKEKKIPSEEFEKKINSCLEKILAQRNERVKPQLDDKILLNWNALMTTALCRSSAALGDDNYRKLAQKNFDFLIQNFNTNKEDPGLKHTCKNKIAKHPAFLDDYACLIQCCIYLQELTADTKYLIWAKDFTSMVIRDFTDDATGFFFYTGIAQKDVILRKKEVYDGATPSGNSIMAENLFYLSVIFDKKEWLLQAKKITGSLKTAVVRYPTSFAIWASVALKQFYGINEIVISGPDHNNIRDRLLQQYLPDKLLQSAPVASDEFPLLAGKDPGPATLIYLCKNYACKAPVNTVEELLLQLRK